MSAPKDVCSNEWQREKKDTNHNELSPTLLKSLINLVCQSYGQTITTPLISKEELFELKQVVEEVEGNLASLKSQISKQEEGAPTISIVLSSNKSTSRTENSNINSPNNAKESHSFQPRPPLLPNKDDKTHHLPKTEINGTTNNSIVELEKETKLNSTEGTYVKNSEKIKVDKATKEVLVSNPSNFNAENESGCSSNEERTPKDNDCAHPPERRRRISLPFLRPSSPFSNAPEKPRKNNVHSSNQMRRRSSFTDPKSLRMSVLRKPSLPFSQRKRSIKEQWKTIAIDAFNIIDGNGDGYLQKEEVVDAIKMMEESGMTFSQDGDSLTEIAEKMMKEVDIDGNGVIDQNEFVEMMRKNVPGKGQGAIFASYNNRMSQLARNVLLAHQKKLENSVIGKDLWLIHPFSTYHMFWDIMVSILILVTVITLPLSIGWEDMNDDLFALDLTIDIIFLFDVVKNFNTGIVDENDAVIMDKRIVRRNYLFGFFVPDFCSSIPLDLILNLAGGDVSNGSVVGGTKNSLRMLRLLRIAKLFRLLRISRLFQHVRDFFLWVEESLNIRISDGFTKLLRLGIGAVVLGHWIGCLNFMLVRLNDFPEDSWVVFAGLEDQDPYTQWSWSFFKALAQMIMIGFETPPFTNASCETTSRWCGIEHWITLLCLYIGAVFYSLLISSISSILQTANLASRQFEEKLQQIDDYMRNKKLPAAMREKVKDCFYLQHSNGKLYEESEILDMLTPLLRREIKLFNGREITVKVPLLSSVTNKQFAEEMVTAIEPVISFQNDIVVREKTTGDEMFFISSGVVEIFLAGAQNTTYVAIGDGCYFGEVSLLLGIRRTASARTKTQCTFYKISKQKLFTVLQDYPETLATMVKVAESRQRRLEHYIDPLENKLLPEDEIDAEDCKTDLFGEDAEKIVTVKEEETRSRTKHRQTHRHAIQRGSGLMGGVHLKGARVHLPRKHET